jgi:hypothetical protein
MTSRPPRAALATVTLFGRPRIIDFTQYGPRGHYSTDEAMQRYFRAAMWASRSSQTATRKSAVRLFRHCP